MKAIEEAQKRFHCSLKLAQRENHENMKRAAKEPMLLALRCKELQKYKTKIT